MNNEQLLNRQDSINPNSSPTNTYQGTYEKESPKTPSGAGTLFYCVSTGRTLLVKRSAGSDYPDTWCGLGGGVELGETEDQAVVREVMEESGYSNPMQLIPMSTQKYDNYTFSNYFTPVNQEWEPVLNREHSDWGWFTSAAGLEIHPGLVEAIKEFRKWLDQVSPLVNNLENWRFLDRPSGEVTDPKTLMRV